MADPITITPEEAAALRSLKRLATKWPKSLRLFSWSGSLHVTKRNSNDIDASIATISNIPNDGGDPSEFPSAGVAHTKDEDVSWIDIEPEILWP
jgi:hypothetical protein